MPSKIGEGNKEAMFMLTSLCGLLAISRETVVCGEAVESYKKQRNDKERLTKSFLVNSVS